MMEEDMQIALEYACSGDGAWPQTSCKVPLGGPEMSFAIGDYLALEQCGLVREIREDAFEDELEARRHFVATEMGRALLNRAMGERADGLGPCCTHRTIDVELARPGLDGTLRPFSDDWCSETANGVRLCGLGAFGRSIG